MGPPLRGRRGSRRRVGTGSRVFGSLHLNYKRNKVYSNFSMEIGVNVACVGFKLKLDSHGIEKIWNRTDLGDHTAGRTGAGTGGGTGGGTGSDTAAPAPSPWARLGPQFAGGGSASSTAPRSFQRVATRTPHVPTCAPHARRRGAGLGCSRSERPETVRRPGPGPRLGSGQRTGVRGVF